MTRTESYKLFLRNYYLSSTLYDFIFAYAIYIVLFSMNGLTPFQISLILAWWAFTSFVLEVPSGALADHWSRKKLLIIAPLIKALCFVIWFFAAGNIYMYGLGFLFWSVAGSFVSGTTEALLYDHLFHYKKKKEYEKVLGKKKFLFYVAQAVAVTIGGVIAYYSLEWTLLLSIVPLVLSSVFAFRIVEVPKKKSTEEIHYIQHIKEAFTEVKHNKLLLYLLLFSLGVSVFENIEEFDQLYYELVRLPLFSFGIVEAIWFILFAVGSYYAYVFKNNGAIYYIFPLLSAVLLIIAGRMPSIPMIGILLMAYFVSSPLLTLIDGKIQRSIKTTSRATVTSLNSLFINLFGIILIIASGLISKIWGLGAIYTATGIFLIGIAIWSFIKRDVFVR